MQTLTLSRRIRSPEDIQVGDRIAITHTRYQFIPDHMEASLCGTDVEPINMTAIPYNAGDPMKVVALCLPFVMVQETDGTRTAIDTRRQVLTRVSDTYAKAAKRKDKKDKKKGKKRKGKGKGKGKGKKK